MKKIFVIILSLLIFLPNCLNAETKALNLEEALKKEGIEPLFDNYAENDKQVIIYFFGGREESKSVAFLNYLNSIYNEYGKYFKLRSYEVFDNSDNKKLMDNVIDYLSANISSVPFIVIGDAYFTTYDEGVNENLLNTIVSEYENEKRVDKIDEVLVRYYRNYDLMIGIVFSLVILFVVLMIYATLKNNKKDLA